MFIFSESDYRVALKKLVQEKRADHSHFNFEFLAKAARIQKSYLSKVIHGSADLNPDQLFLMSTVLGLSEEEHEYLLLLLEHARSAIEGRRKELLKKIESIQQRNLKTVSHLESKPVSVRQLEGLGEYYLDPILQIVHMSLNVPRFRDDLLLLSKSMNLPLAIVTKAVRTLEKLKIIVREKGKVRIVLNNIHLPPESAVYPAWRSQIRNMSLQRLQYLTEQKAYSFSVIFSGDESSRKQIQKKILELLKEIEAIVKEAPSENTYQFNIDLLPWTE